MYKVVREAETRFRITSPRYEASLSIGKGAKAAMIQLKSLRTGELSSPQSFRINDANHAVAVTSAVLGEYEKKAG